MVRLVVKSASHDYLGRLVAPGSLSIWIYYLGKIIYYKGYFKLAGSCKKSRGDAITTRARWIMSNLYKVTDNHAIIRGRGKTIG